jgi:hypothetical protein
MTGYDQPRPDMAGHDQATAQELADADETMRREPRSQHQLHPPDGTLSLGAKVAYSISCFRLTQRQCFFWGRTGWRTHGHERVARERVHQVAGESALVEITVAGRERRTFIASIFR